MAKRQPSALIVSGPGSLQSGLVALMTAIPQADIIGKVDDASLALEMVSEHRPGLVLLDTDLPGDEEWRVLRQIKARWPETRCVILADDVEQQRQAEALGADVVLLKGFPPAKLAETIERLLSPDKS